MSHKHDPPSYFFNLTKKISFFEDEQLSLCRSILSGSCLLSSCGSLCLSGSGLLLSHLLGDCLVQLLLSLKLLGSSFLLSLGIALANSIVLLLLTCLPSIETLLSLSLIECALLDTTTKVLHQVNALALEDVAYCVCWLCTCLYPVEGAIEIQIYSSRIGVRIESTNLLSKFTITWCSNVSDYDAIESITLATAALQSDFCCHFF